MEIADFRHNPEKIALLTDSCADLNEKHRKNKPIFVVPLKIRGGQREFSPRIFIGFKSKEKCCIHRCRTGSV